jgi:ATP-dependent DNA helicase RecQ
MTMTNKNYEELTPYELGETEDKKSIVYLEKFLNSGTINERSLAALATKKICKKYKSEASKLVPSLLYNLTNSAPQVRQVCLNALNEFELTIPELKNIEFIVHNDDKEYNRLAAENILKRHNTNLLYQNNINEQKQETSKESKNVKLEELEEYKSSSMIKLSPRTKDMFLYASKNMDKFSANYAYTNHNFVIQNNRGEQCTDNPYFPIICILKNILMRGCPTLMSTYLQEKLGAIHNTSDFQVPYTLISKEIPIWLNTIKGDAENNYYPAIIFFEEIIPKYLSKYLFIQQLILPEVPFDEITLVANKDFAKQQVDFYLPQAKLVIEVDGQPHKFKELSRLNDTERDRYLLKYGIKTIRIDTPDIKNETEKLKEKMKEIEDHLGKFNCILDDYKKVFDNQNIDFKKHDVILKSTAIIRFQVLILSLLEKGKLSLNDSEWKISVVERDVKEFENLALEDLFLWIKNLSKLLKLDFEQPKIFLKTYDADNSKFHKDYINIDFSLLKRWTDENEVAGEENRIYIRTDYFDRYNYFAVSTDKPIKYKIISDGENSDLPALQFILKNIFGFSNFNSGQFPVITNALMGEDTIGLLPTGGGKSLIYQYVALLQPCINFIVTPIKSLMKDQRDNLDKLYISNSNFINGNQNAVEKEKVQIEYANGKYQFIWISPERFQSEMFRKQLEIINDKHVIGMAVIDEVHCLSEWGHDFRTSYLNLAKTIRKYCEKAQILGLTATASKNVLKDILIEFEIGTENVKTLLSFTRPELSFEVIKDDGTNSNQKDNELCKLLKKLNQEQNIFELKDKDTKSGLIFTRFVNKETAGCYGLAKLLSNTFKAEVKWYSGQCPQNKKLPIMKDEDFNNYKDRVQEDFQDNKFPLLVATKAFGMGIDKSNVRYTIHHGIPGSVEELYQEGGRAGRDKKPAKCYVLFSEEKIGGKYFDKLFGIKSSVLDIIEAQKKISFNGRDAMNNMFLWLTGVKDIEEESKGIMAFYKRYAKPKSSQLTLGSQLGVKKQDLERAIYKLSLIGVTDDWTIEDWGEQNAKIKVDFKDYNDKSIEEELVKYIKKYDKEFDLKRNKDDKGNELVYFKIYEDPNLLPVEKAIRVLLIWQYENVAYQRRESIKTVYDQCKKNESNPGALKQFMESYFKFSEESYVFDHIAENPRDYANWFTAFYDIKGSMISNEKLGEITASLRRFLESFRNNTGLNFISGITHLLTDDYENDDGRTRFEMAIKSLNAYEESQRQEILNNIFRLSSYMNDKNKENLSEVLINEFPDKTLDIYHHVKDNYSLNHVLNQSIKKIRKIRGGIS